MKCLQCNQETNPGYMCDLQEKEGIFCSVCFEVLNCEAHGEGCITIVVEDDNENL